MLTCVEGDGPKSPRLWVSRGGVDDEGHIYVLSALSLGSSVCVCVYDIRFLLMWGGSSCREVRGYSQVPSSPFTLFGVGSLSLSFSIMLNIPGYQPQELPEIILS